MKIKIAHLYYDILNLYGSHANPSILKSNLESNGINVTIDTFSIGDTVMFNDYDLIYMGSSTEANMFMCLEDLNKHSEALAFFIQKGGFVFCAGNSLNMFGSKITYRNKVYEGLHIFNFESIGCKERIKSDVILKYKNLENNLIGVLNQDLVISLNSKSLFDGVMMPEGMKKNIEGYKEYNFYGTNMQGPIFARNPHFLEAFLKEFMKAKGYEKTLKFELEVEKYAYNQFMEMYYKELKN